MIVTTGNEVAGHSITVELGLWRERGTVRTSMRRAMPWAASRPISSSTLRVPCPMVHTVIGCIVPVSAPVAQLDRASDF